MGIRSRSYLKDKFKNFSKPPEDDFWDWIDSFWHKTDTITATIPDASTSTSGKSELLDDTEIGTYTTATENTLPTEAPKVLGLRGMALFWNRIRLFFNEKIFVTDFSVNSSINATTTDAIYRNTSGVALTVTPTGGTTINGATTPVTVPAGSIIYLKRDANNDPLQFFAFVVDPSFLPSDYYNKTDSNTRFLLSIATTPGFYQYNQYLRQNGSDIVNIPIIKSISFTSGTGQTVSTAWLEAQGYQNSTVLIIQNRKTLGDFTLTADETSVFFDFTGQPNIVLNPGQTVMLIQTSIGGTAGAMYVIYRQFGPYSNGSTIAFDSTPTAGSTNAVTSQGIKSAIDAATTGLWDDRGAFSAVAGAYPSSGGSGTAGAILKGDTWTVNAAGTLPTGQVVEVGDIVGAIVDTPGNTQANWVITQNNIGYVAENQANKATAMAGNTTSNIVYLTAKAVYDWGVATFQALNANLSAIAGLTSAVDTIAYFTGAGTAAITSFTAFGRSIVGALNAAAVRILLGIDVTRLISNANTTVTTSDKLVGTASTALTASRTFTMPLASTCSPGQMFVISDLGGAVNGTNYLIIARSGSDTINGVTSETIMSVFGMRTLYADPANNRFTFDKGVLRAGNNLSDVANPLTSKINLTVQEAPDNAGLFVNGTSGGNQTVTAGLLSISPIYTTGKKISKVILSNVTTLSTNPTKCSLALYEYNPVTYALTVVSQLGEITITTTGAQTVSFSPIQLTAGKKYMVGFVFDNSIILARFTASVNPLVKCNYGTAGTTSTPTGGSTTAITYTTVLPNATFNEGGTNQVIILWDQNP